MSTVLADAPLFTPPAFPPREWFTEPPTAEEQAWLAEDSSSPWVGLDGRVFGRLASENSCHLGKRGQCLKPDMDMEAYGPAMRKGKWVAGDERPEYLKDVAVIALATGHCPEGITDANAIAAWYEGGRQRVQAADDVGSAMFHVKYHKLISTSGEQEIWFAGAVSPQRDTLDCIAAASSAVSGEWVRLDGQPYKTLLGVSCVLSEGFRKGVNSIPRIAASTSDEPEELSWGTEDHFVMTGISKPSTTGFGAYKCTTCAVSAWTDRVSAALEVSDYVRWGAKGIGLVLAVIGNQDDPMVEVQPFKYENGTYMTDPDAEILTLKSSELRPWEEMARVSAASGFVLADDLLAAARSLSADVWASMERPRAPRTHQYGDKVIVGGVTARVWGRHEWDGVSPDGLSYWEVLLTEGDRIGTLVLATDAEITETDMEYQGDYYPLEAVAQLAISGDIAVMDSALASALNLDAILQAAQLAQQLDADQLYATNGDAYTVRLVEAM